MVWTGKFPEVAVTVSELVPGGVTTGCGFVGGDAGVTCAVVLPPPHPETPTDKKHRTATADS
jgi:hypothetical protein